MLKNLPLFLLLVLFAFHSDIFAQPELDTTFASTGKHVLQFATIGITQDALVQPDNKILMVGGCFNINSNTFPFCLIRLNENGSFDTSFGGTGYSFANVPGGTSGGSFGIALQTDGKIVAVGFANFTGVERPVIMRFNADGSLDGTFGTSAAVNIPFAANARARKVLIQPDGKIVIVGYSGTSDPYQQFVARLLPDGTLDSAFGGGIISMPSSGFSTVGLSIALQPDGKIVTGGTVYANSPTPVASYRITRLNPNGTLDASFDGDGFVTIPYTTTASTSTENGIVSVAVQGDGRILALADANILYRFNSDGSPDTGFDADGSRPALQGDAIAFDVTVTPSGKITTIGHTKVPNLSTVNDLLFYKTARFLPNGEPDLTFSDDGFLDIDVMTAGNDGAIAVMPDSFGRMVIAGKSAVGVRFAPWNNPQFSVVRLLAAPAQNVGLTGRIVTSDGKPVINGFVTLKLGGNTIANGRTNNFGYFRFRNVPSAQTYTLSARAKNMTFYDQNVLIDGEVTNYTIVGARR